MPGKTGLYGLYVSYVGTFGNSGIRVNPMKAKSVYMQAEVYGKYMLQQNFTISNRLRSTAKGNGFAPTGVNKSGESGKQTNLLLSN